MLLWLESYVKRVLESLFSVPANKSCVKDSIEVVFCVVENAIENVSK